MNWLWAYLRRKTMESIIAGVHDALASGAGPSGLSEEQAAKAALGMMGVAGAGPPAAPPADTSPSPSPPQLTAPGGTNTGALTDQPKRRPGRPRKYQEPQG